MYFNVKLIVREFSGQVHRAFWRVMSKEEMEKYTCYDCWNDGRAKSVNIYLDGERFYSWHINWGEKPLTA